MVPSLVTLALALGPLWFYSKTTDEIIHLSLILNSLFFLSLSFLWFPWPLQMVILVVILGLAMGFTRAYSS